MTRAYDRTNQGVDSGTNTRASTGTNRGRTSDKHAGVHRANTRIILHGPSGGQTCVDLRLCSSIADVYCNADLSYMFRYMFTKHLVVSGIPEKNLRAPGPVGMQLTENGAWRLREII